MFLQWHNSRAFSSASPICVIAAAEPGESPDDALKREVLEESGLDVVADELVRCLRTRTTWYFSFERV
jgi:NADH pyrophosphatase NudC (nudix superfamily)